MNRKIYSTIVFTLLFLFCIVNKNIQSNTVQQENYINSSNIEFIYIHKGTFLMGSKDTTAKNNQDEQPQHEITISQGFYMSKYEITQAQWTELMGENPYNLTRTNSTWESLIAEEGRFVSPQKPATVSWNDAQNFIQSLNQSEGHNRYRLPTEAEWEYVARAGTNTLYSFGNDKSQLNKFAWAEQDFTTGSIHEVGQKQANNWGLYDMHGNVWEWTNDYYAEDYYSYSPTIDPAGPSQANERVVRGGSWHQSANSWHCAFRRSYPADYRGISIGFRLVLEVNE